MRRRVVLWMTFFLVNDLFSLLLLITAFAFSLSCQTAFMNNPMPGICFHQTYWVWLFCDKFFLHFEKWKCQDYFRTFPYIHYYIFSYFSNCAIRSKLFCVGIISKLENNRNLCSGRWWMISNCLEEEKYIRAYMLDIIYVIKLLLGVCFHQTYWIWHYFFVISSCCISKNENGKDLSENVQKCTKCTNVQKCIRRCFPGGNNYFCPPSAHSSFFFILFSHGTS